MDLIGATVRDLLDLQNQRLTIYNDLNKAFEIFVQSDFAQEMAFKSKILESTQKFCTISSSILEIKKSVKDLESEGDGGFPNRTEIVQLIEKLQELEERKLKKYVAYHSGVVDGVLQDDLPYEEACKNFQELKHDLCEINDEICETVTDIRYEAEDMLT